MCTNQLKIPLNGGRGSLRPKKPNKRANFLEPSPHRDNLHWCILNPLLINNIILQCTLRFPSLFSHFVLYSSVLSIFIHCSLFFSSFFIRACSSSSPLSQSLRSRLTGTIVFIFSFSIDIYIRYNSITKIIGWSTAIKLYCDLCLI